MVGEIPGFLVGDGGAFLLPLPADLAAAVEAPPSLQLHSSDAGHSLPYAALDPHAQSPDWPSLPRPPSLSDSIAQQVFDKKSSPGFRLSLHPAVVEARR